MRLCFLFLVACAAAPVVPLSTASASVPARPSPGCFAHATAVAGDRLLTSGGRTRRFRLTLPDAQEAPMPLVLNMHGLVETAAMQQLYSAMDGPARARGMAVVYPQGVGNSWNAGECCGRAHDESSRDVTFLRDLVRELSLELCIDQNRIYATGMSNGAFMSYRLACDASDLIAAIAPVAGVEAAVDCRPARPVPVLAFNGTSDPLVHYDGGWFGLVSVEETMKRWTARNRCAGPPSEPFWHSESAHCAKAPGCAADTVLCTFEGGGHTWPGSRVPMAVLGRTPNVDATTTMLDFFLAHPLTTAPPAHAAQAAGN